MRSVIHTDVVSVRNLLSLNGAASVSYALNRHVPAPVIADASRLQSVSSNTSDLRSLESLFMSATGDQYNTAPVARDETRFTPISVAPVAALSTSVAQEHGVIIVDEVVQPMQVDGEGEGDEGDGGGDGGNDGNGEIIYYGSDYDNAMSYSPTADKSSSSSSSPIIHGDEDGIYSNTATLFPGGRSRITGVNVAPPMASYFEQVLSSATQKRIICTAIDRENDVIQKIRAELRWLKISDKKFCLAILSPHDAEYYWAMSSELVEHKYLDNSVGFFDGMKTYSPNGNRIIQREFRFRYPQYFGQKYVSGRSTQEHHVKMIEFLLTTGHCTINRAGLYFRA